MEGKERKRADDLPAGAVEQVREMLNRPRSSADCATTRRRSMSCGKKQRSGVRRWTAKWLMLSTW